MSITFIKFLFDFFKLYVILFIQGDESMKTIGENIRKARKAAGLTQKELGRLLNVTSATISAFENNKTNIKATTAARIADALNCDICDIITIDNFNDAVYSIIYRSFDKGELEHSAMEENLLSHFADLNNTGKEEAVKRVEELTHIDKYTKAEDTKMPKPLKFNAVAAHERTDIEVTDEMRAADDAIMEDDDF